MHSHDRATLRALVRTLIAPRRVAVVGSQGPTGFAARLKANLANLGSSAGRSCEYYFISRSGTPDGPVFDSFQSLPHTVDTALISVPAEAVVRVVRDGMAAGTRCFIVHSAGFGESDSRGRMLQDELVRLCDDAGAVVLGPNCIGLHNQRAQVPLTPLLLPNRAATGGVALISQSGTVANTLLNTSRPIPFSCIVTTGNEAGVTLEDVLDVFVEDPAVTVIGLFVEQLRQPRVFVELALRAHELGKPIVALKTGVTSRGASMTRSHTGALAGSSRVYAEVFRRVGVVSARDVDELAELLLLVSSEPRVLGARRAAILGNSGGLLALAADVSESVGLELSTLSESTVASLRKVLQTDDEVEPGNPLDYPIGFRNTSLSRIDRFRACLEILDADENTDVVAVATELAEPVPDDAGWVYCAALLEALGAHRARSAKPVVAYSHASNGVHPRLLEIAQTYCVPLLEGVRPSLNAIAAAGRYGRELPASSLGTIRPPRPPGTTSEPTGGPQGIRDGYQVLAGLGVPFVEEITARTAEEAVEVASSVGMPVVLKVKSPDIAHKAAVGGVATHVHDATHVRTCFESILRSVRRSAPEAAIDGVTVSRQVPSGAEIFVGLKKDPDFGPVILVGSGGVLVNEIDDARIVFPPIDDDEAASIVRGIRPLRRVAGWREDAELPGSCRKLSEILVNLSRRSADLSEHIDELDINPIIVWGPDADQLAAVDVHVVPTRNRQ